MNTNLENLRLVIQKGLKTPENAAPALLTGVITSVKDPEKLGRAKVLLDYFAASDNTGFETTWVEPLLFKIVGNLPFSLLNKRVICHTVNNSFENLRLGLTLQDLVYRPSDEMPAAGPQNLGLQVIRVLGSESFLAVCLLRNGQYVWESMAPLLHFHSSGDTLFQGLDAGGNAQQPITPGPTTDQVYGTSVTPYFRDSKNFPPILSI